MTLYGTLYVEVLSCLWVFCFCSFSCIYPMWEQMDAGCPRAHRVFHVCPKVIPPPLTSTKSFFVSCLEDALGKKYLNCINYFIFFLLVLQGGLFLHSCTDFEAMKEQKSHSITFYFAALPKTFSKF